MVIRVAITMVALAAMQTLLVAVVSALRPRGNIYAAIIGVAFATAPLVFFSDRLFFERALTVDGRVYLVLVHLALGALLFHFMTLPDRSVTLRIFVELLLAPGGTLTLEALNQRYSVRAMIASRLQQLADGRFIEIGPGGIITLKPRGVRFGRFVTGGRRLFRISSAN